MILPTCLHSVAFAAFLVFPEGDKNLKGEVKSAFQAYKDGNFEKAAQLFKAEANRGDANAMFAMGRMHQDGSGVERNLSLAEDWYRKAAEKNHSGAQFNLGVILAADGARVADGIKLIEAAASNNSSKAQLTMGQIYANGQGRTQDYGKAREWFQKAAEGGETDAFLALAQMYENGLGVTKDFKAAVEEYKKGAARDSIPCVLRLAAIFSTGVEGVPKDVEAARKWLIEGALKEKESTVCEFNLGVLAETVDNKPEVAFGHYQKAAQKGDLTASLKLGNMYTDGVGVAKDPVKAFEWYDKAAKGGLPAAKFAVSVAYDKGLGVTADAKKSLDSLLESALGGFGPAMREMGQRYRKGTEKPEAGKLTKDILAAITWLRKATAAGDVESYLILAEMYEKGEDVARDWRASNQLLSQVASAGVAEAQVRLAAATAEGRGTPVDVIRAYALLLAAGDYEPAKKKREEMAKKLSPEQLKEAERELDRIKSKPNTATVAPEEKKDAAAPTAPGIAPKTP